MQPIKLYLVYSGTQEDEDGVRGIYDDYGKAIDNVRKLMDICNIKFHLGGNDRWESKNGYCHIYIDEVTLNAPVL